VVALHRLVNAGPDLPRARKAAEELDERLSPLVHDALPAASWWRRVFAGPARRERARGALAELADAVERARDAHLMIAQASVDLLRPGVSADEAWIDYELRGSDYQTLRRRGTCRTISPRGSRRSPSTRRTGGCRCAATSRSGRGSRSSSGG
jgi:hypothetical protein